MQFLRKIGLNHKLAPLGVVTIALIFESRTFSLILQLQNFAHIWYKQNNNKIL